MSAPSPHADPEQRRGRPVGYFDLLHDLPLAGCAICRGESRTAWRYLDGLLWEGVMNPWIRAATKRSHGFCREHAMMAVSVAGKASGQLGMAILFEDLLHHVEDEARTDSDVGWRRRRRRRRPQPDTLGVHQGCQACASAHATTTNYLTVLIRAEPSSEIGVAADAGVPTLCLPHLRMGVRIASSQSERQRLLDLFSRGAEQLRGDLLEFIRKRDYRFSHEVVSPAEATAWVRSVFAMVGEPRRRNEPRR